jgi:flagellar biosynthetic protein FlhB
MADQGQKTEQPTQRRMQKARREGQFPLARHFVASVQFVTFVALLGAYGGGWVQDMRLLMAQLVHRAFGAEIRNNELIDLAMQMGRRIFVPLGKGGMVIMLATLAPQLAVTRLGTSTKKLAPDFKRLSPLAKLRELPKQNIPALLQALVLLPVFSAAIYYIVKENLAAYMALPLTDVLSGSLRVTESLRQMLWRACMLFLAFGAVDLVRQKRRYQQELKMSKQEIRDEVKEMEGNPEMNARFRRLRRDLLRRRMMHQVPTATAVIVNPTHFAVAIRYEPHQMAAPLVVAKGKNYLALRIRQKALENQVPLIENPPLAQALYKSVDVGQEIPAHLYRAVAEILAYIYKLTKRRLV